MTIPTWIISFGSIILKWLLGLIGKKPDPNKAERKKLQKQIWKLDDEISQITNKMLSAIRSHNDKLRAKYDDKRLWLIERRRVLQQRFDDLK